MLTSLRIEHFAIVKHLELDFANGMTAFTGETGAGKSIMIDALTLALGGRADASLIRPGKEKCDITAGFHVDQQSSIAHWLDDHDLAGDEGEIFLRRIIYREGRSKSYINGQPVPIQKIRDLSEQLVHIHGQHQHQALMHHSIHREQLDQYANHLHLRQEVAACYKKYQQIAQEIEHISTEQQQADAVERLQFQLNELSALNLKEGEIDALNQEHQLLHHACEYITTTQHISTLLSGDEGPTICSGLNQVIQLINQLPQDQRPIKNTLELINSALIQCEEAANEIAEFAEHISLDPLRLNEVEERMSLIHQLARKYHIDSQQLLSHQDHLATELTLRGDAANHLLRLNLEQEEQIRLYQQAAMKLRQSRTAHAKKLGEEITASIQKLGMPKGWVTIELTPLDKFHEHGQDKIEYKVCTNPGMELDSLNKVASGGELSRIGLAIQMITAQKGATPTLLFDEVDVGIGGATAALVGQMLRQLGERLQVFCVTHQPQVAAAAHHHFMVEKQSDDQETFSNVVTLESSAKIDEIARMLGGLKITDQTRSHAKELLQQSNHLAVTDHVPN